MTQSNKDHHRAKKVLVRSLLVGFLGRVLADPLGTWESWSGAVHALIDFWAGFPL